MRLTGPSHRIDGAAEVFMFYFAEFFAGEIFLNRQIRLGKNIGTHNHIYARKFHDMQAGPF